MKILVADDCITNNPEFAPVVVPQSEYYTFIIHANATLFLFQNGENVNPQIENGNKLVVEYRYRKPVNPMIKDAGYTESILFEIDPDVTKFLLSGKALDESKALYGNLCFCPDAGYHPITEGCIKGKKLNRKEWLIEINIKAYGKNREFSKMLSEKFIIKE